MLVSDELKTIINNSIRPFTHSRFDLKSLVSLAMGKMVFSLERAMAGTTDLSIISQNLKIHFVFIFCKKSEDNFIANGKFKRCHNIKTWKRILEKIYVICHRTLSKSEIYKWSKRMNKKKSSKNNFTI